MCVYMYVYECMSVCICKFMSCKYRAHKRGISSPGAGACGPGHGCWGLRWVPWKALSALNH